MFVPQAEDTVPVWRMNEDGTISNIRPTIYHRNAEAHMKKHGSRGIIGLKVKNRFGDIKTMTFKQAERLKDLFETGLLTVVDYWRVHHVPTEYALSGYDTECENSGIYNMPTYGE